MLVLNKNIGLAFDIIAEKIRESTRLNNLNILTGIDCTSNKKFIC